MKRKLAAAIVIVMVCAICAMTLGCRSDGQTLPAAGSGSTPVIPDVIVNNNMPEQKKVIVVSGKGEAKMEPDMATVYVNVASRAETAEAAQTQNTETVTAVIEAIKAAGVGEKDIQTEDSYLNEEYDYSVEPAMVVGYTMRNTTKLTIRDVKKVDAVLTAAIAAGATGTYGLELKVSDSADEYAAALKAAVADAKTKADALAESLGVTLEPVPVDVQEQSSSYTAQRSVEYEVPMTDSMTTTAADAGASVSTGELTVTADVTITYAVVENQQ